MRSQFPLFQSHLDLAHHWWGLHLRPNDVVIDATAGNGHDTGFLAKRVIPPEGSDDILLHAIEIQKEGLENARSRLAAQLTPEQLSCIAWHHGSHETLPCDSESVRAVIYNLGYLPGGDKTRTTLCRSTLLSLTEACRVIAPGGLISVTCYPGHSEGAKELEALMAWTQNLSPQEWCATWHHLVNRNNAPTLLLLQKKLT